MTYEALLENTDGTFELSGHTINLHKFRVSEYGTLREILEPMAAIMKKTESPQLRLAYLLTDALKESCAFIACGTDLSIEAIVNLTPQDFMVALSKTMEANIDFFLVAALDRIESAAGN